MSRDWSIRNSWSRLDLLERSEPWLSHSLSQSRSKALRPKHQSLSLSLIFEAKRAKSQSQNLRLESKSFDLKMHGMVLLNTNFSSFKSIVHLGLGLS